MIILVCVIAIFPVTANSAERKEVRVGAYPFPPYYNIDDTGVTVQLIHLFNEFQHDYQFIVKIMSSKRRYEFMEGKKIDMIMFEDQDWGWEDQEVEFSKQFFVNGRPYQDGDLYVTLKEISQDQSYFDTFRDKTLLLTRGYHYAFANNNADETYLNKHFQAEIATNPEAAILKLLLKRGDIGLVTQSLLRKYISSHPAVRDKFFICDRKDSIYDLGIVLGRHAPLTKEDMDNLLTELERSGRLDVLFKEQHLID